MGLKRIKIGDVIKQRKERYDGIEKLPIFGVSRDGFIPPKQLDADTSIYHFFYKNDFVFNPARMELNSIAYNKDINKAICSSLYEIFYVYRTDIILPEYLNLFIKRKEFARKCWFKAIGSARNYFRIPDLSLFELEVPDIEIQKKYVAIYEAMLANLKSYERNLDDLKLVCDGYIENIRRNLKNTPIGNYIEQYKDINSDLRVKKLAGLIGGEILQARKSSGQENLEKFQIIYPNSIVYPPPHFGEVGTIGIVKKEPVLMSPMYITFKSKNPNVLFLDYALLWFRRNEFKRYAFFVSCSSIRDTFDFELLKKYSIPVPNIETQQNIVSVLNIYNKRKEILNTLRVSLSNICPILIAGSIKEAKEEISNAN